MATKLPYVNQSGTMVKILQKVKEAKTPERFTTDFLETKLGARGGNSRQFIPLAKKMGLLNSDGTPSELYKTFRNPATSGTALAQALKHGYRELFERNEFANSMKPEDLKGMVVEITGLEPKNRVVLLICQTFETLKKLADFEGKATQQPAHADQPEEVDSEATSENHTQRNDLDLRIAYTINLVLPKTDDPAVFNAIFRSLRDNLLRQ
jgi:hypothetical protein